MFNEKLKYISGKSKYICDKCSVNRVSHKNLSEGYTDCSPCRKVSRDNDKMDANIKQIEAIGYVVKMSKYDTVRADHKVDVECVDCGRVKSSTARRLLVSNGACVCKQVVLDEDSLYKLCEIVSPTLDSSWKVAGVYRLTIGTESYVGSSMNMKERIKGHFTSIRRGKHTAPIIKAVLLNGIQSVKCEILGTADDEGAVRELEQVFMDKVKPSLNILKDARLCRRVEVNSLGESITRSDEELMINIMKELKHTRDLSYIASKYNTTYNVVAGFSSGKSYTWLKVKYPLAYAKATITGSRLGYSKIIDILCYNIQNKSTSWVANKMSLDESQILLIGNCRKDYLLRLVETDETIRKLYEIIRTKEGCKDEFTS